VAAKRRLGAASKTVHPSVAKEHARLQRDGVLGGALAPSRRHGNGREFSIIVSKKRKPSAQAVFPHNGPADDIVWPY
jgi:hypothetical protein